MALERTDQNELDRFMTSPSRRELLLSQISEEKLEWKSFIRREIPAIWEKLTEIEELKTSVDIQSPFV